MELGWREKAGREWRGLDRGGVGREGPEATPVPRGDDTDLGLAELGVFIETLLQEAQATSRGADGEMGIQREHHQPLDAVGLHLPDRRRCEGLPVAHGHVAPAGHVVHIGNAYNSAQHTSGHCPLLSGGTLKCQTPPCWSVWGLTRHGGRRQCMTPRGVQPFWGVEGGGGGPLPPPWLTQTLGVGGSGGQPPGSRGWVGGYPKKHTSK